MNVLFILGNSPELSLAELSGVLAGMNVPFTVIGQGRDSIELNLGAHLDVKTAMHVLGGCIKIGSWIKSLPLNAPLATVLSDYIAIENPSQFTYGISVSSVSHLPKNKRMSSSYIKRLSMEVKRALRAHGIASRCVLPVESTILSSVQSDKNGLLSRNGIEFLLVQHPDAIHLYSVSAVQPFEDWSFRDYGRPRRSMSIGMLPPKIARMMVNISQAPFRANSSLLDPFCGTGTILQEAALGGVSNLTGSDISNTSIQSSRQNLNWLSANFSSLKHIHPSLRVCGASQLEDCFARQSFDAIVTEVYLGPILHGTNSLSHKEIEKLELLYAASFRSFARILRPRGIVVIALPYWPCRNSDSYFLPSILPSIEHLGFINKTRSFLAPFATRKHTRNSILFSREGQSVGREIGVFSLQT